MSAERPPATSLNAADLEARTQAIGLELFQAARQEHARLSVLNRWTGQVLAWCLADPQIKTRVLRLIDCLPTLRHPRDIVRHVREYFPAGQLRLPPMLQLGVSASRSGLLTAVPIAAAVRHMVEEVAKQFIGSATVAEAGALLERMSARQIGLSVDVLGEQVLSEPEADEYAARYAAVLHDLARVARRAGSSAWPQPMVHVSIKPSSLSARVDPASPEGSLQRIMSRLLPLARLAVDANAAITLDMEQYELRDLTLELAKRLLAEPQLGERLQLGVVIQAYVTDAEPVVEDLVNWLSAHRRRLAIRLVKGAYWDYEVALAIQHAWPVPVYQAKWQTDQAFERLTKRLLQAFPTVRAEIASHNVRSIAHAMAVADAVGRAPAEMEFQVLYGMANAIQGAIRQAGYPVRVYTPLGELIPGMAYLVRRLLENTANESFLRHDMLQDQRPERWLAAPGPSAGSSAETASAARAVGWRGEPRLDVSKPDPRRRLTEALAVVRSRLGRAYPMLIGAQAVDGNERLTSRNPSDPSQIIGQVGLAGFAEITAAVNFAQEAQPAWARLPARERTACLRRAAALLRERRCELAAWEVLEVGKTWKEADADLIEAIDYLEYYSDQMEQMASERRLPQLPGEQNRLMYLPRGVAVVIAPWNFPIGILTGMASAALVSGHTVILKPAEQSSVIAAHVAHLLREAGVPPKVVQLVPGRGPEVGSALVRHPKIPVVLFTGSKIVGTSILKSAAQVMGGQHFVKHIVLEMGGKNAIIVDADADLDAAIQGALVSAFGYQGQKCSAASRLIVLEPIYEAFLARFVKAVDRLVIGDPADPETDLGPLIDEEAYHRLTQAAGYAHEVGRVAYASPASRLPKAGYFVGPTIVTDVPPQHTLARDELFGPLVCVFRVRRFEDAVELANNSDYGLTGGVYSRLPSHLQLAMERFDVGNLYLNRPITGAMVGRQPFGGCKLSGLGTKAGGPDYLRQLVVSKTICDNTARHGMPLE